ncbi:maleylpyruvate isomerase family mycothiol-dependent enzyme [Actinomadura sp. DC4]|uniref:maleylpyruvate isomerase family mycothiol-dependent enzyme n=1 Tax=Actinomadura sp. DC4 TaxID=3055069 RepID=UPI0025AEF413|nr:maleylpyruvate isomerase family mycothiol-dependent enzyme [Actinomadura sp. DC4]MDN3357108.1 maleylpyruvate isomerase family mycothiol-dependent enzyme [Actinomadura sp. DC4]
MSETAWQANIDAFEQTLRSMFALGGELDEADWGCPTECPGWSVKDQYSHILGVERWLLGETDDGRIRTVANTQLDVEALRGRAPEEILGELRGVIDRRVAVLRSGAIDLAEVIDTPLQRRMTYGDFMRFRAFDIWMHEQDVRRAAGRPGNLAGPAADCSRQIIGGALPFVVGKRAAAVPGQTVVVETPDHRWCVEVGDDRRARLGDGVTEPTVRLRMEWETFARLGGGRVHASAAEVEVAGDADLAGRVLAGMAVTP